MPSEATFPDAVEVMGLRLTNLRDDAIAANVVAAVQSRQRMLVVNANAHMLVLAQKLQWLPGLFRRADIAFCDGAGAQLAARLLTGHHLHRTTPPDWIGKALSTLGPHASVFWVGGRPEVVNEAARRFAARYNVQTAGIQHGFFDPASDSQATRELVARINRAAPSILLVNMGMPRQERWLLENFDSLPPCVAITGGAMVDHAAGVVRRPPRWVSKIGAEWLVRLIKEPRRLWRRYLLGLPLFAIYIIRFAVAGGR
jgi:N-acetylglucosaminyldiphosphoundecaprenol N-acetyl-beta-D-mannosaminyltransferase